MRPTSKNKKNDKTKLSMCASRNEEGTSRTSVSDETSSRWVDDVDALAGMLPAYMLAHMTPLFAASAAVRTLKPRSQTAFVTQVSLETLHHGVTVAAFWTHVITSTTPTSTASSSLNRCPPNTLVHVGLRRVIQADPIISIQKYWKQNNRTVRRKKETVDRERSFKSPRRQAVENIISRIIECAMFVTQSECLMKKKAVIYNTF